MSSLSICGPAESQYYLGRELTEWPSGSLSILIHTHFYSYLTHLIHFLYIESSYFIILFGYIFHLYLMWQH